MTAQPYPSSVATTSPAPKRVIAWIGPQHDGVPELERMARARGHELVAYDERRERDASGLHSLVERADLVVLQSETATEDDVTTTREAARRYARPLCVLRRAGTDELRALLGAA